MRPRLYFGHPINMYNTPLEAQLLEKISLIFPDHEIENPNQPHHSEMYRKWKEEFGNGMKYFFEEVLPHCTAGIFLPFRDGKYGAGVYDEAKFLAHRNLPIYRIAADGIISPIASLAEMHTLRVKETKLRVYAPNGGFVPY